MRIGLSVRRRGIQLAAEGGSSMHVLSGNLADQGVEYDVMLSQSPGTLAHARGAERGVANHQALVCDKVS